MNNQLERLIAEVCDADKRNTDPAVKKASELVIAQNVAKWYEECNH